MQEEVVTQQIPRIEEGIHEVPKLDREALIAGIGSNQIGHSSFHKFLYVSWKARLIEYECVIY